LRSRGAGEGTQAHPEKEIYLLVIGDAIAIAPALPKEEIYLGLVELTTMLPRRTTSHSRGGFRWVLLKKVGEKGSP
jgi:hypothetical protein